MKIALQIVVLDAADLTAESTFWAELLGGTVDAEDDWHNIYVDGEPRLAVQFAPGHVPPTGPMGPRSRSISTCSSMTSGPPTTRSSSLGARLLKTTDDIESTEGYQVTRTPPGSVLPLLGLIRRGHHQVSHQRYPATAGRGPGPGPGVRPAGRAVAGRAAGAAG